MIGGAVLFATTQLSIALFGLPAAFHPAMRHSGWAARIAAAFLLGAVLVTVEGTLLSLFGMKWGERSLALPLLLLSAFLTWRFARRAATTAPTEREPLSRGVAVACLVPLLAAIAHLFFSLWYGFASSAGFIFLWGTKAARFAQAKGLEPEFLTSPFAAHAQVNDPQLFPTTLAWSATLLGDEMFRFGALTTFLWFLAALPLVHALLRRSMKRDHAFIGTTAWAVAMSLLLAHGMTGGSAAAPLVTFTTVAALALMLERADRPEMRFLASLGLAGAVITEQEGLLCAALLLAGWLARALLSDRANLLRRAMNFILWPLAAAASWWVFQVVKGIASAHETREPFVRISLAWFPTIVQLVNGGSFGLSWILPLLLLLAGWRRWREVVPALALLGGAFVVYGYDYLRSAGRPTQGGMFAPALSALVLAALIVAFARKRRIAAENLPGM